MGEKIRIQSPGMISMSLLKSWRRNNRWRVGNRRRVENRRRAGNRPRVGNRQRVGSRRLFGSRRWVGGCEEAGQDQKKIKKSLSSSESE